jgi:hypothetical protein
MLPVSIPTFLAVSTRIFGPYLIDIYVIKSNNFNPDFEVQLRQNVSARSQRGLHPLPVYEVGNALGCSGQYDVSDVERMVAAEVGDLLFDREGQFPGVSELLYLGVNLLN